MLLAEQRRSDGRHLSFHYQTIETLVPKKLGFPQESPAGRKEKAPVREGTCFPERYYIALTTCQVTLQDKTEAQAVMV